MIPIPHKDFFINKFVDVKLPTKRQIFARTGQVAVSPNGVYTGENRLDFGASPTEKLESFVQSAESFEPSQEDLPVEDEKA